MSSLIPELDWELAAECRGRKHSFFIYTTLLQGILGQSKVQRKEVEKVLLLGLEFENSNWLCE